MSVCDPGVCVCVCGDGNKKKDNFNMGVCDVHANEWKPVNENLIRCWGCSRRIKFWSTYNSCTFCGVMQQAKLKLLHFGSNCKTFYTQCRRSETIFSNKWIKLRSTLRTNEKISPIQRYLNSVSVSVYASV